MNGTAKEPASPGERAGESRCACISWWKNEVRRRRRKTLRGKERE